MKRTRLALAAASLVVGVSCSADDEAADSCTRTADAAWSVPRHWNEATLAAIRDDFPAPTVHARNLFHSSAAMWDAWAAFDPDATGVFVDEEHTADDVAAAREEAMSFAAYRILVDRLWPRGLSKDAAQIDIWAKELAPSHELRRWFHSDEGNWTAFKTRYRKELSTRRPDAEALRKAIGRRKATFLYASKAEAHNHAQLLEAYLEKL